MRTIYLQKPGQASVDRTPTTILGCRGVEVLFCYGVPVAVSDGVEVSFPDLPDSKSHRGISRTVRKQINLFHADLPQTRVDPEDFQYLVVSGLMRALRPLLRRNSGEPDKQ